MATIRVHTPNNSPYYGVYLNTGIWYQADASNDPTGFAICDEVVTSAGTYNGSVYGGGETFTTVFTSMVSLAYFEPDTLGSESGSAILSGVVIISGSLTGGGISVDFIVELSEMGVDLALNIDDEDDATLDIEFDTDTGDLKQTDTLDTLILTLLFTDARASKYQSEQSLKRRGWLGDLNGEIFRSKLWLKDQARKTDTDVNEISAYCEEALQYMIDNKIADDLNISTEIINGVVTAEIAITVGQNTVKKYVKLWRILDV